MTSQDSTPSPTIAAPSPSNNENKAASSEEVAILNEKYALKARKPSPSQADDARHVTNAMVEALARSLAASSADAYHAWLARTDEPYSVLRAALQAALATPPTEEK